MAVRGFAASTIDTDACELLELRDLAGALPMARLSLEPYRKRLLNKEHELVAEIERLRVAGRSIGDLDTQDLADQANNTYSKETIFQHTNSGQELLSRVRAALQRIEEGEFGACFECAEPVEKKRLDVVPWAEHCVACQHLLEEQASRL